jgi:hypothetical protein
MFFLIVVAVIFIYAPVAVRLLTRGGPPRLWLGFAAALSLVLCLGFVTAAVYAETVPEKTRLVLFFLGFGGSTFLLTTLFLHLSHLFRWGQGAQALAAFGGSILGVVLGTLVVVYGLRSW